MNPAPPPDHATIQQNAQIETQTASGMAVAASSLVIQNDDEYQQAADQLMWVQTRYKVVEDTRTAITKPILDSKRLIDALFAEPKKHYDSAKRGLKKAMNVFLARKEQARQEALALAQQASDQGDQDGFYMAAQSAQDALTPVVGGVHTRDTWRFEILDRTQVPGNFMMVDERALRAFIMQNKDSIPIPGVRIFKEQSVVARSS